jgi:regulatory protein
MKSAKVKRREPLNEHELFDYAIGVLAKRMRTVRDLKRLMCSRVQEGEAGEQAMDAVCARLKETGYLSDKRFAADYTRLRKENEKFGRRRVQQDLMLKGVHRELIATALSSSYDDVDEAALAREYIARKRLKKPAGENPAAIKKETARVMGRLARAGFSSGTIYKVLREWDLPEDVMPVEGGADSDSYAERDEDLPEF